MPNRENSQHQPHRQRNSQPSTPAEPNKRGRNPVDRLTLRNHKRQSTGNHHHPKRRDKRWDPKADDQPAIDPTEQPTQTDSQDSRHDPSTHRRFGPTHAIANQCRCDHRRQCNQTADRKINSPSQNDQSHSHSQDPNLHDPIDHVDQILTLKKIRPTRTTDHPECEPPIGKLVLDVLKQNPAPRSRRQDQLQRTRPLRLDLATNLLRCPNPDAILGRLHPRKLPCRRKSLPKFQILGTLAPDDHRAPLGTCSPTSPDLLDGFLGRRLLLANRHRRKKSTQSQKDQDHRVLRYPTPNPVHASDFDPALPNLALPNLAVPNRQCQHCSCFVFLRWS